MNVRTCLLFGVSLCACALPAVAQDYLYATGSPVYSTSLPIDHGVVNVNNGEIHLEIPIASKQQRGPLAVDEKLVYDSRIWHIAENGGLSWQPNNGSNSSGGWLLSTGIGNGNITYDTVSGTTTTSKCPASAPALYKQYAQWNWTDPNHTVHPFVGASTIQMFPDGAHCLDPGPGIPTSVANALDGSGYTLSLSNFTTPVITDVHGIRYYPQLSAQAQAQNVTDANGNYWSQDTNGNLIDTSGQTPVITTTNGNTTDYAILGVNGTRQHYTVTMTSVSFNTAFHESAVSETSGSFNAVQKITLPDGSAYTFTYDSGTSGNYGEMTSMTLPTGGLVSFGWSNFFDSYKNENRWLTSLGRDGGTTTITPAVISSCTSSVGCEETQTVRDPAGNDTVYTFSLDKAGQVAGSSWLQSIGAYQGPVSSGKLLRDTTSSMTYSTFDGILYNQNSLDYGAAYSSSAPDSETQTVTLKDTNVTSQVYRSISVYTGLTTEEKAWDFTSGGFGSPTTDTSYLYDCGLPASVIVKDGSGNQLSSTTYGFDEITPVATTGVPHHTSGTNGCNATSMHQWVNTSDTTLDTTMRYDDTGTLLSATSPNGTTSYGHDSTDTFVTSTTLPTPPSGVLLTSGTGYDASTGAVTSTTDANNQSIVYKSFDAFNRPQEVDNPDGGVTAIGYSPTSASVSASNSTTGWTIQAMDAYGRLSRLNVATGVSSNPWYMQDTCYNASGQISFQSYRFQGQFSQTRVCSGAGDSYIYDALGRVTQITHGDGTTLKNTYTGRAVETIDENGISKIVQTNAFGQTTSVCELTTNSSMPGSGSPSACGTDIAATGFTTSYSYDNANHKITIAQGAQTRVTQTDSLGRTMLTQEPERGTTTYAYSYNGTGLVVTRTRPKANQTSASSVTTTTTQYDEDGRAISVNYSDGTNPKTFLYDQTNAWGDLNNFALTNSKGRLTREMVGGSGNGAGEVFGYDAMGRPVRTSQCEPAGCGNGARDRVIGYTWDYAGNQLSGGDGTGTVISYSYTPAAETTGISSSQSDATHPATLLSQIANGPFGPTSLQYGNGLYGVHQYDTLGRLDGGWLCSGSSAPGCSGGTELYGYTVTPKGSRVNQVCDSLTGNCANMGYDDLGRLTSRTTSSGTTANNGWSYDRYGNRWSQSATVGGNPSVAYNTNTNQESGFAYDAAGNMSSDGFHSYTYDAEGNVTQVDGGRTASYVYDAANRRVRSVVGSSSEEFAFNLAGQRVSTWNGSSGAAVEQNAYWGSLPLEFNMNNALHFQYQDWLGSERMVSSYSGIREGAYTSLPFGDSLAASGADADPYHFAMLDHDYESGLDHAQFREYSSAQGHWMSPDPYDGSYDGGNPQTFNRYTYVLNNPFGMTDPSGQDPFTISITAICGGAPGACVGAAFDPIALGVIAGIGGFIEAAHLFGWFDGPQFHGSLKHRPNAPGNNPPDHTLRNLSKEATRKLCSTSPSAKILSSVRLGAVAGAGQGAFKGFISGEIFGGEVTFGSSGIAGAALGAAIQGSIGGAAGVFSGAAQATACASAGAYTW